MKWLPDRWLLVSYCLAGILSLVVLTSISPDRVLTQAIMLAVGAGIFIYLSRQETAVYLSFAPFAYGLALLLLLVTLVAGHSVNGATRWIGLFGQQLQAGEFTKPLLLVAFAYFLEKYPPRTWKNVLINLGFFVVPTFLVFRQPDLGTTLVLAIMWVAEFFVAGAPLVYLAGLGAVGAGITALLPRLLHSYQLSRLESFLDPYRDPLGAGYNVIQSIIAVGSGGIFGKGLGHGTQSHLRFLPERQTDFIFASLAEELGLAGSLLVLGVLGVLLGRLLLAVTKADKSGNRILLTGIFSYLAFQALVNIGMNVGVAPVTGITLPLISYGGSSVITTAVSLGIAASAMRESGGSPLLEIK